MLTGKSNTMKNYARCNERLATMPSQINVGCIVLPSLFDRTQRTVCGGKESQNRKYHLGPTAWVLPGESNTMKNYARCEDGLGTILIEVNVRLIVLLCPFDR